MKKIVGILAAAAVLATSVFAADVSAKVRVGGKIFDMDGTASNEKGDEVSAFKLFTADTVSHTYDAPFATISTSTDEAGATVKFVRNGDNVGFGDVQVWMKPIENLKIQAGSHDLAMNKETIDWTEQLKAQCYDTYGYSLGITYDAISANIALGTGQGDWFFQDAIAAFGTTEEPAFALVKDLYVNFAYGADFGTISAFFRYRGKTAKEAETTYEINDKGDIEAKTTAASFEPTRIDFGAGYKNTIDSLTFFVDVVGSSFSASTDKEEKAGMVKYLDKDGKTRSAFDLGVDAFVQYSQDALTAKGFIKYETLDFGHLNSKGDADIMADNNTIVELLARVDYKLDNGLNLFAYFKDANLLNKQTKAGDTDPSAVFASTIKLGASGNVGIASWETYLQLDTGVNGAKGKYDKVNVSMPCYIQVAF